MTRDLRRSIATRWRHPLKDRGGVLALDHGDAVPLYRQIYDRVRDGLAAGSLRPGDRLPSARALATELGAARGTVDAAYALLQGEGYIIARGPAGNIVSPDLAPHAAAQRTGKPQPSERDEGLPTKTLAREPMRIAPLAFRVGMPALDAFPRTLWSRLVTRRARALAAAAMDYPDPAGDPGLRAAIASYLIVSRGINCTSGQILVTNGYQDALDLVIRVLLPQGDDVWFEDPGYLRARERLDAAGAKLVPIRVDAEGLRVSDGLAQAPRAHFAVVTPSHQSPLGVALSLPRRLALLSWASEAGAWILEDDYDSEFRYQGRPLPALKSLDRDQRVLYTGSFSKVLFPGLRLGYLVVPEALVTAFARAGRLRHSGHPTFEQLVVADFMTEGYFARHLKGMRVLYAARRRALAEALAAVFGDRLTVDLEPGGMHLIAWLRRGVHDVELAKLAQSRGFALEALSSRAIAHAGGQGLLLGFTNLAQADALETCRRLERVIGKELGSRA
jgi:GntR family transcriptional regulator/MocR family aminotransferase